MNREGYKTPTEDVAIGNETIRERLREKYHIREGDAIKMLLDTQRGALEGTVKEVTQVRIKAIHKHFVTVIRSNGLIESFQWWDFSNRRK